MLVPQRAPVRPRVISPTSGESLLLEEEILSLLERKHRGVVWLVGGPGSGKTTALAHLSAVLPTPECVILVDENDPDWLRSQRLSEFPSSLFVLSCRECNERADVSAMYHLTTWTDDELIEYVLTAHPEECRSVMHRFGPTADRQLLDGDPELCRSLLDVLALEPDLSTIKEALRRLIEKRIPDSATRALAADLVLGISGGNVDLAIRSESKLAKVVEIESLKRFLFRPAVGLVLATDRIVSELRSSPRCEILESRLPPEIISETALLIREDSATIDRLRDVLTNGTDFDLQPTAASLIHAMGAGWRPARQVSMGGRKWLRREKVIIPNLRGAILNGVFWPRIDLSKVRLDNSNLSAADLTEANLDDVQADAINLSGARLVGASLAGVQADLARITRADLSYVRAENAQFQEVDAREAIFEGALLTGATFRGARLAGANFSRANLKSTCFVDADIEGTNFSRADLTEARLTRLSLRLADFSQCCFRKAHLVRCDLEGMNLPGPDFAGANLVSALLTETNMPGANFRGADLADAGLAHIDWEQADLRDADLRGASFHLGSSRSGLVDSPIASYGSRTGFYTDDYNEQDFKAPEEIRKANLRGADLRGAKISGVDFYLVDLRDALYDPHQEQHFRGCGAILEARAT